MLPFCCRYLLFVLFFYGGIGYGYVHYSILVAFFLSGIRYRSVAGKKSKPKKDQKVDQKKTTFCEKEDQKATIFLKNPLQKSQD